MHGSAISAQEVPASPYDIINTSLVYHISIVLLIALAIRIPGIDHYPLFHDELFTVYWIDLPQNFLWGEGRWLESNPPLFYSALKIWTGIFGTSEAAVRFPSVIASSAGAALCVLLGRLAGGPSVGLFAGLLAALLPFSIVFSSVARPIAFVQPFLVALLVACLLYIREVRKAGSARVVPAGRLAAVGAAFVALATVAIYTHATSLVFVGVCGATMAGLALADRRFGIPALLAWTGIGVAVALLCLPQILPILSISGDPIRENFPPLHRYDIIRFAVALVTGEGLASLGISLGQRLLITCALAAPVLLGLWRLRNAEALVLAVVPALFILLLILGSLSSLLLHTRMAQGLVGPFCVLAAAACFRRESPTLLAPLLLSAMVVLSVSQARRGWTASWHPIQDNPSLAAIPGSAECPGPLFVAEPFRGMAWPYYGSRSVERYVMQPESRPLEMGVPPVLGPIGMGIATYADIEARIAARQPFSLITSERDASRTEEIARRVEAERGAKRHSVRVGLEIICVPGS